MSYSVLIQKLKAVIEDVHSTDVVFTPIHDVPNVNITPGLTFECGDVKRGRTIRTCVLYVDMRDSVKLNEEKQVKTMGRIYTAFIKAVLIAVREEGGCVRNIIGDRVMAVFPEDNCFQHAVHCAFTINNIAFLISKTFPTVPFKCGIGIDYGAMSVLKVGIDSRDDEKQENMNLVWVGYPANYASRLTDMANKKVTEQYRVTGMRLGNRLVDQQTYSKNSLLSLLRQSGGALMPLFYQAVSKYEPIEYTFPSILVTEAVYNGYAQNPGDNSISLGLWEKQDYPIKDIKCPVYGNTVSWKV